LKEYLIDKGNFGFDYTIYPYLMAYNTFVKNGNIQPVSDSVSFETSFIDFVNKFNYAYPDKEITEPALSFIKAKFQFIFQYLTPGSDTWKYIDALENVHPIEVSTISGLPNKPLTMICYNRFSIALIGFDGADVELEEIIKTYINVENQVLQRNYNYKHFDSVDELNEYVKHPDYNKTSERPAICFGINFKKNADNDYSLSLYYFSDAISHGVEDFPNN
jgi:hypothetical protein